MAVSGRLGSITTMPPETQLQDTQPTVPVTLVDAAEAGRLLSVPASWVLAEARAGRIPHVRLGRYVRFSAQELEDWWRARMRGPLRARGADSHSARSLRSGRRAEEGMRRAS